MNDDLSQNKKQKKPQKNMEIWHFLQMFWKDSLSKKISMEHDLSCIIREDDISFSRKYDVIIP